MRYANANTNTNTDAFVSFSGEKTLNHTLDRVTQVRVQIDPRSAPMGAAAGLKKVPAKVHLQMADEGQAIPSQPGLKTEKRLCGLSSCKPPDQYACSHPPSRPRGP